MALIGAGALDKLAVFAARGESEEARRYMRHVLRMGADLEPIRKQLRARFSERYVDLMLAELPWLAEDEFGRPTDCVEAIRETLGRAGAAGMSRTDLREAIGKASRFFDLHISRMTGSGEIVASVEKTGGRPVQMLRLAAHARGAQNPGAIWHDAIRPEARVE